MFRASLSSHRQILVKGMTSLNPDSETLKLPKREEMISKLKKGEEFDLLIIGAGATGSGAALEAASRGLKVACIEREDFASGTSSRSTKLLWGGSRYLVQAFVSLLSSNLITSPIATVNKFYHEFRMVMHAHKERNFMLKNQHHLAHWVPIAVPLTKWFLWPPPFDFAPAAVGPLGLFPLFFKFYDALGGFNAPPSHIMTASRSSRKFPQLANKEIKYCSVFYEGMHDDARTNLAIAQTAAMEGAVIANYCEAVSFIKDGNRSDKVVGAVVVDRETNESFEVTAKGVVICGGPFTDEIRRLEDPNAKEAVTGASGIHIVLPAYYNPTGIGLVDMSTSDGRFLFFLPWNDHVLVGTTDHKCKVDRRPVPDEAEIQWLLHEASKYISPELRFRRKDVLSAWAGIRPLASDPHAAGTAGISRDHVVSHNPKTGVIFVSGGKWTTFRQMAEDAIDAAIRWNSRLAADSYQWKESDTINLHYIGFQGYSPNLAIQLIQRYGISPAVANRLVKAYGGRAHDVLKIAEEEFSNHSPAGPNASSLTALLPAPTEPQNRVEERLLIKGFPYLEAEVAFATRYEWVRHAEDFLAHRTRLAFLNRSAAIRAIPRVVELMGLELGWDLSRQESEVKRCLEFMRHIGGSTPLSSNAVCRMGIEGDMLDAFKAVDSDNHGFILREELPVFAELMNYHISEEEIEDCVETLRLKLNLPKLEVAQIPFDHLFDWWNSDRLNPGLEKLRKLKMANIMDSPGSGTMFG